MSNQKKISVIIPFLNEADNIQSLVNALNTFFKNGNYDAEVIFVDDGSTDDSVSMLRKINHEQYSAKVISLSKNYGSHAALRAGLLHCTGDYVTFVAADLQDPLDLISKLYNKAEEGFDIVLGSRNNIPTGFFERTFSSIFAWLMKRYVYKKFPKNGFDVIFFNKKVKERINNNIEANSSLHLQILSLGYSQCFINYDKVVRKFGKSKWTLSKKIKLLIDSFVAFSFAPIRMVSILGIVFFIIGLGWSSVIIARKLIFNNLVAGWPMLISILLLGFGITNISLGIIAEYLWRTLDASRKRPVFIIDEIIDLPKK